LNKGNPERPVFWEDTASSDCLDLFNTIRLFKTNSILKINKIERHALIVAFGGRHRSGNVTRVNNT